MRRVARHVGSYGLAFRSATFVLVATAALLFVGALVPRNFLAREDIGFVNPLQFASAKNDITLQAALTHIATLGRGTLMVPPGVWTIANSRTIPDTVDVLISQGATLSVNSGVTLTVNGTVICGPMQPCFEGGGTVLLNNQPVVYPEWFGTRCDGATDDAAAIRRAVVATASQGVLQFRTANCVLGSAVVIDRPMTLVGMGRHRATLLANHATTHVLHIRSAEAVTVRDLWIDTLVSRTGGAGIYVEGTTAGANRQTRIENVYVSSQHTGIHFAAAAGFVVRGAYVVNSVSKGIHVENTDIPDAGDSTIEASIFDKSATTGTAIYQASSGGLRLINNKILNHEYGYRMDLSDDSDTSILVIQGNSIENQGTRGIALFRTSGTKVFSSVIINGNHLSNAGCVSINVGTTGTWLSHLLLTDNVINVPSGCVGIGLDGGQYGWIADNEIIGNGGSSIGIDLTANASNMDVGHNVYRSLNTNLSNLSVGGTTQPSFLSASASLSFGATGANECEDSSGITIAGAADGHVVSVGAPITSWAAHSEFTAYVSAANTVKVRRCNNSGSPLGTLTSQTFRVSVFTLHP